MLTFLIGIESYNPLKVFIDGVQNHHVYPAAAVVQSVPDDTSNSGTKEKFRPSWKLDDEMSRWAFTSSHEAANAFDRTRRADDFRQYNEEI